jgi:hypothetical protein
MRKAESGNRIKEAADVEKDRIDWSKVSPKRV